ncbi:MAG: class I SAM-dependent methyltransferase [Chitinophagaceae bacterium]|nr:MAG: class I SAM-dependent methyltransferase [Chitinophagaceae bacterium]
MSSSSAYTGNIPQHYEQQLGPVLFEPYAEDLAARVPAGTNALLELACGTGRVTRHLDRRLSPSARLVASDLNSDMLTLARSIVFSPRVEWLTVDAGVLPFADGSFDAVVCQFGVMFFTDKRQAFREACRVLRAGGTFLFNTWLGLGANPRAAIMSQVLCETLGAQAPDLLCSGPYSFHDEAHIALLLEEAGFRDIRVATVSRTGHYADPAQLVAGFVEGSPLGAYLDRFGAAMRGRIRERLQDALVAQEPTYGNEVPMRALVVEAKK